MAVRSGGGTNRNGPHPSSRSSPIKRFRLRKGVLGSEIWFYAVITIMMNALLASTRRVVFCGVEATRRSSLSSSSMYPPYYKAFTTSGRIQATTSWRRGEGQKDPVKITKLLSLPSEEEETDETTTTSVQSIIESGDDDADFSRGGAVEPKEEQEVAKLPQWRRNAYRRLGGFFSGVGFVGSSVSSLFTDRGQFQRWKPTVEALQNFLKSSGIELELSRAFNQRFVDNVVILSRVERAALAGKDRRDLALCRRSSSDGAASVPSPEESLRYMKYATAAYGDAMIQAAELDVMGRFDNRWSALTRTRISEHCSIPEEDIIHLDVDHGKSTTDSLRHFVAVDHKNEKVVLAIRGTFSLSELVVDVAGFSRPFCGGEAHSEMANMAERIWGVAGDTVIKALEENKRYELIITGHSLGAGTASLLNILAHQNRRKLVRGHKVRCFTYASPPVFVPLSAAPAAVQACTNYIHENDVVPFLSIDAVRHLFNCIRVVDERKISWTERKKLLFGRAEPDEAIREAVEEANRKRLKPKPGAPPLFIAAEKNLWLRDKESSGTYDMKLCDSKRLADLGIFFHPNMLEDHFPSRYQHALHNLGSE